MGEAGDDAAFPPSGERAGRRTPAFVTRRRLLATVVVVACLPLVAMVTAYTCDGSYGVNVMPRRGANFWIDVSPGDPRPSPGMRLSLQGRHTPDPPQPVSWRSVAAGLDVAELPVRVDGRQVDAVLLTRIDPAGSTSWPCTAGTCNSCRLWSTGAGRACPTSSWSPPADPSLVNPAHPRRPPSNGAGRNAAEQR